MQRYLLLMVLFFGFCLSAFAQKKRGQERIDSLLVELQKSKEDTNKVHLLDDISWGYRRINTDEGIKYGEQGLALAEKLGWKKGKALLLSVLGNNYNAKSDNHKALEYYAAGMKIDEELNNKKDVATSLGNMANVYDELGNYTQSLEYHLKSLNIYEELGDTSQVASALGNIGASYAGQKNFPKALEYLNKFLKITEQTGNKGSQAAALNNMGIVYKEQKNYDSALAMYRKALEINEALGNKTGAMMATGNMGNVYAEQKKYKEAVPCLVKAMTIAEEIGDKRSLAIGVASTGELYLTMAKDSDNYEGYGRASNMGSGNLQKAILYLKRAVEMYTFLGAAGELPDTYKYLSEAYRLSGNYKAALDANDQYLLYRDSVFNKENTERITRLEVEGEYQRKQLADSLKNLETKKLSVLNLQRQKTYTYIGIGAVILLLGFGFFMVGSNRKLSTQKIKLSEEKQKSEDLLLNILPSEVAMELKDRGATTAKQFDEVTVLFTDFVNFTGAGERMGTEKLVDELHNCFKAFDAITDKYNIEKIKTIGDAYLAVCGLPLADEQHAENVVRAAMEIRAFMQDRNAKMGNDTFEIRIGVHSGPVVAGIVGVRKFAYDIWGDTVNTAARMEQNSVAGKINISETTYELVKDKFNCEYRGEIAAKNKGMLKMYFINETV